jgi:hypothetical protein
MWLNHTERDWIDLMAVLCAFLVRAKLYAMDPGQRVICRRNISFATVESLSPGACQAPALL